MVHRGWYYPVSEKTAKGMGKLKGKGGVILTTCRLILINIKDDKNLKAFDLPYANTYGEKFQ